MNITGIGAPGAAAVVGGAGSGAGANGAGSPLSFGETLQQALEKVSATEDNASLAIQSFLRGEPVELHQVMAATEEAGIAVEMLVQLRDKFVEAYRAVVQMQG